MSRYNPVGNSEPILAAAAHWADRCLSADGSLFADEDLWNLGCLDELDRVFVRNLDESERNFFEKLEDQLSGAAPPSRKLMAEALWLLTLFQTNISPEKKRENVQMV